MPMFPAAIGAGRVIYLKQYRSDAAFCSRIVGALKERDDIQ